MEIIPNSCAQKIGVFITGKIPMILLIIEKARFGSFGWN